MPVFEHTEYLQDVLTPAPSGGVTAFDIQRIRMNPGQRSFMPWGSTDANQFIHYRLHNVSFIYHSTSGDALNSTNTALGLVLMRCVYDPTLPTDTAQVQMQNASGTVTGKPSQTFALHCSQLTGRELTVNGGAQPAGTDLRFYDEAFFEIATVGMQAQMNIGKLYISYSVEYDEPQYIQGQIGQTIYSAHYRNSTFTNAAPLGNGTAFTVQGTDYIGMTATGTTIVFPNTVSTGEYMVFVAWVGTAAAITYPAVTITNGSLVNIWGTAQVNSLAGINLPSAGATSGQCGTVYNVSINAPGNTQCTLTFGGAGTLPTSGTQVDFYVTQVNQLTN